MAHRSLTLAGLLAALLVMPLASALPAFAQDPTAPLPNFLPPPPPPPPPPSLAIPKIPKMGETPTSHLDTPRVRQKSFNRRIQECLDEGMAAGLGPNERAAYSRACANSR